MNKRYIKYVWLLVCLVCTFHVNQVNAETPVEQHVDDIAVILVNDSANPKTFREKAYALYEKIKHIVQDFRSKPKQDPNELKRTLTIEIVKLLAQGKITPKEVRYLKDNQVLLEKLSDKSSIVLVESIGNLSKAHTEEALTESQISENATPELVKKTASKSPEATNIANEIIEHLSHVLAEIIRIVSYENKAFVDKVSTHLGHLRVDFEQAFQKSLLQCFTDQELNELRNFVKSPAFQKLLTNVPLLKEIFFKNLSPEILSKLKSLI